MKKLKLFAKNFQKIGKNFQKIIKKYTFFAKFIKKIAKLAKNFGYCTKKYYFKYLFYKHEIFFISFCSGLSWEVFLFRKRNTSQTYQRKAIVDLRFLLCKNQRSIFLRSFWMSFLRKIFKKLAKFFKKL